MTRVRRVLAEAPAQGVYGIADAGLARPLLAQVELLLGAGVRVIQLRLKAAPDADVLAAVRAARGPCARAGALLLVNDHVHLAREADGVHLGQHDGSPARARAALGPSAVVGVSTHDLAQARAAAAVADYLGFGPVFATATKADPDPVVGPLGLRAAVAAVAVPVVAIGGITPHNVAQVAATGACAVAAIAALAGADDVQAAAAALSAPFRARLTADS